MDEKENIIKYYKKPVIGGYQRCKVSRWTNKDYGWKHYSGNWKTCDF